MAEQRPWHRLFGLSWMDFFTGLPVTVEMEKDLSLKKQLLDVLLIRKEAEFLNCRLPDGFEDLARFNLVTFKSHMEKLSLWALLELGSHYLNLRKQVSPSMDENALLHLFSTRGELLGYGVRHYHIHSAQTSTLLVQLFQRIRQEINMPTPLEEFARETIDQLLKELPADRILQAIPAEQILKGMPLEQLLKTMPIEKRLEGLTPEQRVQGLSVDDLLALVAKLKGNGAAAKPE